MDPEFKLLMVNSFTPFLYILVAGLPFPLIAWTMNKSAGYPKFNGNKISKWVAVLVGAACVFMAVQKNNMDYPFWQPLIGSVLGFMFWSARVPLFERSREAYYDEQRIFQGRKDKLNV